MADMTLSGELLTLLREVDTPTVCNAIETAQGKRGFNRFTRGTMLSSAPGEPAITGFARTARISAIAPPVDDPDTVRARRMDYYRSMAEGSRPSIAVVEDVDFPHCAGAWWGEVNTTVHKGLGVSGAVTNGLMRDLGNLASGFPVIAGGTGPSHAFVHVVEIGTPVTIFGMRVSEGELIHADRHGALVIPPETIPVLESAVERMCAAEELVLGPAREPGFDIDRLEAAWTAFEKART